MSFPETATNSSSSTKFSTNIEHDKSNRAPNSYLASKVQSNSDFRRRRMRRNKTSKQHHLNQSHALDRHHLLPLLLPSRLSPTTLLRLPQLEEQDRSLQWTHDAQSCCSWNLSLLSTSHLKPSFLQEDPLLGLRISCLQLLINPTVGIDETPSSRRLNHGSDFGISLICSIFLVYRKMLCTSC